jgi:hypothetical protein
MNPRLKFPRREIAGASIVRPALSGDKPKKKDHQRHSLKNVLSIDIALWVV